MLLYTYKIKLRRKIILKKICILKSVTVLAVIIMSIGLLTGCEMKFGNKDEKNKTEAYEEPVKNLIEGLAEANSEKFLNAFPPFISNPMPAVQGGRQSVGRLLRDVPDRRGRRAVARSVRHRRTVRALRRRGGFAAVAESGHLSERQRKRLGTSRGRGWHPVVSVRLPERRRGDGQDALR